MKRRSMSEREFQRQVMELLGLLGWRSYHTWLSIRSSPGFPDIVAVKGCRVLFVELKSDKGQPSTEQEAWLDALRQAGQEAYLWRPADWDQIVEILRREHS